MSEPRELERFLPVALAWLRDLTARRVEPRNALRELEHLRLRAPALGLELVWEATGPESEVHYDLLLTHGRETVVMARRRPSPGLRGVQRWSDKHVVRVDGELLDVETLMARLDFQWSDSRVLTRLVDERRSARKSGRETCTSRTASSSRRWTSSASGADCFALKTPSVGWRHGVSRTSDLSGTSKHSS